MGNNGFRGEVKVETIQVQLADSWVRTLQASSIRTGLPVSELVRLALVISRVCEMPRLFIGHDTPPPMVPPRKRKYAGLARG